MNKYLLEAGTEELPYHFVPEGISQLKRGFEKFFADNGITYSNIKTFATPRRLAIIAEGLPDKKDDVTVIVKGPSESVAFDAEGKITKAGLGFAKKNGVTEDTLFTEDGYVKARIEKKGARVKELLEKGVPEILKSLNGSHFMRWGSFEHKFQRPVTTLVSLFNDEEAPIEFFVKSGRTSRGHRFAKQKEIEITIDGYENEMLKVNVIADFEKRKQKIVELCTKAAEKAGAQIVFEPDLLEEVTCLTEWPVPVVCDFSEKYLRIPDKVNVTVMAVHQRYFPLYKDGKLLNKFVTVANFVGNDGFDNIKAGNERVVTARLEDGIFFFEEDTKKPLEAYVENLKGITFQKGMGSVFDKTQRIKELSGLIADDLKIERKDIERTALLCKADLATSLVFEFTELQGFIGCDYAKHCGENEKVATGIKEHYFPLNASSPIAEGIEGQIVGIADKIDTVTVIFASGAKISGSQDPLGVRRAALGVLKTVLFGNVNINIEKFIRKSIELLPVKVENPDELFDKISNFYLQRLKIFLSETYNDNVIDACISNFNALADLKKCQNKLSELVEICKTDEFSTLCETSERIYGIVKGKEIFEPVNKNFFVDPCENALFEAAEKIDVSKSGLELSKMLYATVPQIQEFFDKVLVMDKDENIKNNRLKLLTSLKSKFDAIADFSKLNEKVCI